MGSDSEPDPYPLPKLRLLSEPSGASTPPLHTTATVPFRWEEHPGKPRPCTDIIISTTNTTTRSLELPPRLTVVESNKITKTSSPTTVLDGPTGRLLLSSSSFRFEKERRRKGRMQGSFDSSGSGGWSPNDEGSGGGPPEVVAERGIERRSGGGGGCRRFGSFRVGGGGGRRDKGGVVVSPSPETVFSGEKDGGTMRRNYSLSKVTRAHFWATIYEGFKQVVPWRKKSKKESFNL